MPFYLIFLSCIILELLFTVITIFIKGEKKSIAGLGMALALVGMIISFVSMDIPIPEYIPPMAVR